ncbi:hypothetical protein BASA83_013045 [Batrachochytrium salamandrivorans]|nr:hypothetical protein BASA83_013045 [Batrachochytrium salamandrivorans]
MRYDRYAAWLTTRSQGSMDDRLPAISQDLIEDRLVAISQDLMDDGLAPVLAKLIQYQHHVLQIKALELAGHVGSKLGDPFIDEFIPKDRTLAIVAELQSMHPAVRLLAAKACVVILPIASFNDHLTACFDLVFDAFCAETDPPILLELMKVITSRYCHSQFYSKIDAIVHKIGLLIGSRNIRLAVACTDHLSTIFDEFFQDNLDRFARSGMIELFVQSLRVNNRSVVAAGLKSLIRIYKHATTPKIIDQFKTINILDVLSRLFVKYPNDTRVRHDVLKLGYHMASDMDYSPLPSAFREAIGKLVESIADENLDFPDSKLRTNLEECGVVGLLQTIQKREDAGPDLVDRINQFAMKYFSHLPNTFSSSFIPYEANSDLSLSAALPGSVMPDPHTLVELRYLEFIGSLLAKSNWWEKIHDELISSRWRSEALAQDVSEANIDLAFDQLRSFCQHYIHKASHGSTIISPGAVERTFVMDHGVPESVYKSLIHGVAILEDVPDYKKDWHPGTDNMVLDLIHPSLFCLVYGFTCIPSFSLRKQAFSGISWESLQHNQSVAGIPTFDCSSKFSSRRFQWLPSEFYVEKDGHVSINSYINNLNPVWHPDLYKTIASVFECFVPMLENLAGTMKCKSEYIRINDPSKGYSYHNDYDSDDDPLRGRHLQVIVKLASIHLTPDKPRYNGGSWHIEGTINEFIVATCLYYYEMENITSSKLSFRQAVEEDFIYERPSYRYYKDVYGISNEETETNQHLGSLDALPGRCIVFPNMLQHKVMPFELADPSKPGVRKILAFFLIDPSKRIVFYRPYTPATARLTDNKTSSSALSAKASKPTGVFGKTTDNRRPDQPRPTAPPPPLSRQILAVNVANISNKRPAIRHIVRNTRLWAISETCITPSKFRFTVPGFDGIQHPATGPGRRGIALGIPSCFGGHEHGSAVGTMILAKVPNFTPECLWIVGSVYVGHSGATINYSRREAFASIRQSLDRVVPFDNNHPVLIFGDWNTDPQRLQRIVHSWGHGLTVMQFSGSQITRLSTVHGRRHSSIDHFVCNAPACALLTSPRVDRQTAVADHFVIRTSIRAEAQGQPPAPHVASDDTDTDTDIHQLTSQFLESANAVADNWSLWLSPPATRSNRRLLSGATKRAILASNTARQAFIAAATHTNPDPVQCNTLRDEWSRLKAAATQLERVDGRKQWVKHADNLDRAVSDGRTDLVFAAARAMSGNSSRSAAVTPLYSPNGIVQYDPTSILRVMQGHYGSLAADTTGHSLDLQYWRSRSGPVLVGRDCGA